MSIESVITSSHLILCHPLLLLPSIFPSIRVFSNESALRIRWPKYWSFGFSISPSNEYSGLISFRMDWLDLLVVQRTLKSLLQYQFKSINSSALSFLYIPTLTSIHDNWKHQRSTNYSLRAKFRWYLFFVNKVLLEHSYIGSFMIVYGCLPLTMAELTCYYSDYIMHRGLKLQYLAPCRKILLTLGCF